MFTFRVHKTFAQAKVNDVDGVLCAICVTYHNVVWFDIAVNYSLFVYLLNNGKHLDADL